MIEFNLLYISRQDLKQYKSQVFKGMYVDM